MGEIAIDIGLPWFTARASISWADEKDHSCLIAARSPPSAGWWGEIPIDRDLYSKYGKKPRDQCDRPSQASRGPYSDWYTDGRARRGDREASKPPDRDEEGYLADTEAEKDAHVAHEAPNSRIHPLCDQGRCTVGGWPVEAEPTIQYERAQIPFVRKQTYR